MDENRLDELLHQVMKEPVAPPPGLVAETCEKVRDRSGDRAIVISAVGVGALVQALIGMVLMLYPWTVVQLLVLLEMGLVLTNGMAVVLLLAWRPVSSFFYRLGIEPETENPHRGRTR